jgi:hypothetical protein
MPGVFPPPAQDLLVSLAPWAGRLAVALLEDRPHVDHRVHVRTGRGEPRDR